MSFRSLWTDEEMLYERKGKSLGCAASPHRGHIRMLCISQLIESPRDCWGTIFSLRAFHYQKDINYIAIVIPYVKINNGVI